MSAYSRSPSRGSRLNSSASSSRRAANSVARSCGDPGVTHGETAAVALSRSASQSASALAVGEERQIVVVGLLGQHDRLGRATVEPLGHGPHLPGADHLEEPGRDEDIDVVRDRALRLPDAVGQFGHGHRPLEHEIEHEHPDRLAQRLHPLRACRRRSGPRGRSRAPPGRRDHVTVDIRRTIDIYRIMWQGGSWTVRRGSGSSSLPWPRDAHDRSQRRSR